MMILGSFILLYQAFRYWSGAAKLGHPATWHNNVLRREYSIRRYEIAHGIELALVGYLLLLIQVYGGVLIVMMISPVSGEGSIGDQGTLLMMLPLLVVVVLAFARMYFDGDGSEEAIRRLEHAYTHPPLF